MKCNIEYLKQKQDAGVDGLHVYSMNKPEIARAAMCALKVALVK